MSDYTNHHSQSLPLGGDGGGRYALLLSGGVDSAVALHLMMEQGLAPDLYYIKIGMDGDADLTCTAEEDLEMCRALAHRYGRPLEVVDLQKDYWERVVSYTMQKVKAGLTPNPDVMCNRLIKFGAFEEKVGHQYDRIVTGHYARTIVENGETWLATAPDPVKDQTDFLAQNEGWQIRKAVFPIGHLMKSDVRRIAEEQHLAPAHRKDSQGICFLGKINYTDFVRRFLGEKVGPVIDIETGRKIGEHKGYWFHTIGQRKGLGFGGGPWFVVKKDLEENILYVAHGFDTVMQYGHEFDIRDFHFLTGNPWENLDANLNANLNSNLNANLNANANLNVDANLDVPITFKVRHTDRWREGTLTLRPDGTMHVSGKDPIQGIAPGQFAVVYTPDARICIGSGEIAASQPS